VASSTSVRGAKAKGSGNARELELNPADDGSSHRRNHVMATTPTKPKKKKKMKKTS
jgi:hypothetical protein